MTRVLGLLAAFPNVALAYPPVDEVVFEGVCYGVPVDPACRFLEVGVPNNHLDLVTVNTDGTHGAPGDDLFPTALCNDGTPAIYYVAPGAGADASKWVLTLQGAGQCDDYEDCTARWCGTGSNYTAEWMSSGWEPYTNMGGAVHHPDTALNKFASWNHVMIRYCSSDFWTGANAGVEIVHPTDDTLGFVLEYQGRPLIDAVLSELRSNPQKLRDLGMPSLDDADKVLFGGSTSGGSGTIHNLDRVAEELLSTNPGVEVLGVMDSAVYAAADTAVGAPYSGTYDPSGVDFYMQWDLPFPLWGSQYDESCEEAHQILGDTWWCAERMHVLTHHVSTPFFAHSDLIDEENPLCKNDPCPELTLSQMVAFADIADDTIPREGPPEYDSTAPLPGFHAPECGVDSHAAFDNGPRDNTGFFELQIPIGDLDLVNGNEWLSFHDALYNWVTQNGEPTTISRSADVGQDRCPLAPPVVPSLPVAEFDVATGMSEIRWDKVVMADDYVVYWSPGPGVDGSSATFPPVVKPSLTIVNPVGYACYRIQSRNATGVSPLSNEVCDVIDMDADDDGIPDSEDTCDGMLDWTDKDWDFVANLCDQCDGFDDRVDGDSDGIPDGCDVCPAGDDNTDTDGDGHADACDACPDANDFYDEDGDLVPDGCDACPGSDDALDGDGDAVPDDCDLCLGDDALGDADGDGACDTPDGEDTGGEETDDDGGCPGCGASPGAARTSVVWLALLALTSLARRRPAAD